MFSTVVNLFRNQDKFVAYFRYNNKGQRYKEIKGDSTVLTSDYVNAEWFIGHSGSTTQPAKERFGESRDISQN